MAEIYKEAIIGFIIVKCNEKKGNFILTRPITADWEACQSSEEDLKENEEVLAILSAPPEAYKVFAESNDGNLREIGFEFKGASHPDWEEEAKNKGIK